MTPYTPTVTITHGLPMPARRAGEQVRYQPVARFVDPLRDPDTGCGEVLHAAPTYSDDHIERCARLYDANGLWRRGIRFDVFVSDPEAILQAALFAPPSPPQRREPLLPRQQAVCERLLEEHLEEELRAEEERLIRAACRRAVLRDGAYVEPLHRVSSRYAPRHNARRA